MKSMLTKVFLPILGAGMIAPALWAQTVYIDDDMSQSTAPGNLDQRWITPVKAGAPTANVHPDHWAIWDVDPDGTTVNNSLWSQGGNFVRLRDDNWADLEITPTNAEPVVFSYRFYDLMDRADGVTTQMQNYGELASLSNTILFAFGVFTSNTHYAVRRWPAANWEVTSVPRSVGWKEVKFVIHGDTFDLFVDDEFLLSRSYTGTPVFDRLSLSGSFANAVEGMLYDDVYLAQDSSYARAVVINTQPYAPFHTLRGAVSEFGETISFSVDADGPAQPLSYQWFHEGEPMSDDARISGSQTNSVTINGTDGPDSGLYWVVITDANDNSVASASVHLTSLFEHEVLMNAMDVPAGDDIVGNWGTFSATGGWFGWKAASTVNVLNAEGEPNPEALFTFRPTITQAGWYEVWTFFVPSFRSNPTNPQAGNRTNEAPYHVNHASGEDLVFINQQADTGGEAGARWVFVGTYEFEEGTDGTVVLSNHKKGPSGNDAWGNLILADAVRWIPTDAPPVDGPAATVNITRGAGADVELIIVGKPSTTYAVEVSDDLAVWTPLGTTTTNAEGLGDFIDADATSTFSRRFYRVSEE